MDIFIGYDASTVEAYVACTGSIRENTRAEKPVIHGLNHRKLRADNLFDRKWSVDDVGQFWDQEDGRPFSTEFSFGLYMSSEGRNGDATLKQQEL